MIGAMSHMCVDAAVRAASDFGYKIARQFGIKVLATKPALVPLRVDNAKLAMCTKLSGVSQD